MGAIVFKNKDYQLLTLYLAPFHILIDFYINCNTTIGLFILDKNTLKNVSNSNTTKTKTKTKDI